MFGELIVGFCWVMVITFLLITVPLYLYAVVRLIALAVLRAVKEARGENEKRQEDNEGTD